MSTKANDLSKEYANNNFAHVKYTTKYYDNRITDYDSIKKAFEAGFNAGLDEAKIEIDKITLKLNDIAVKMENNIKKNT